VVVGYCYVRNSSEDAGGGGGGEGGGGGGGGGVGGGGYRPLHKNSLKVLPPAPPPLHQERRLSKIETLRCASISASTCQRTPENMTCPNSSAPK